MDKHLVEQRTDRLKKKRAEKKKVRRMNAPFINNKEKPSTQSGLEI